MSKIALSIPIYHHWNHLYYQNLTNLDYSYPLPFWYSIKQDQYIERFLKGYFNSSCGKFEIQKRREGIDVYVTHSSTIKTNNPLNSSPYGAGERNRNIMGLLKNRINIYNLYTFPIHEGESLVKYLLTDSSQTLVKGNKGIKERLNNLQKLLKLGIVKGIKLKIKGRYKKSTRTQSEIYQFGQIPNTPTTNLSIKLYYTSAILLQSLGSSSLHLYIIYRAGAGPHI